MTKQERYDIIQNKLNVKVKSLNKNPNRIIHEDEIIKTSLLAKYTKSVKAIYVLDSYGFYEDAKIILRSIFELFIIILYCETDTTLYYRYKNFQYIILNKYFEGLNEEEKNKVFPKAIENIKNKVFQFSNDYYEGNFKKVDKSNWNGIPFKETVNRTSKNYNDNEILIYYDVIYKLNCENTHSDYNSIIKSYLQYNTDYTGARISSNPEQDDNYIDIINKVEAITDKLLFYLK